MKFISKENVSLIIIDEGDLNAVGRNSKTLLNPKFYERKDEMKEPILSNLITTKINADYLKDFLKLIKKDERIRLRFSDKDKVLYLEKEDKRIKCFIAPILDED